MKRFLCVWLCCLVVLAAHGQSDVVRTFMAADGLPDNTVTALYVDGHGISWVGTRNGLVQFDGHRLRPVALSHGRDIRAIVPGLDGMLTAVSHDGSLYEIAPLLRQAHLLDTIPDPVLSMASAPDGTLWIGTEIALYRRDAASGTLERQRLPVGRMAVHALAAPSEDGIWVGGSRGFGRVFLDDGRWRAPVAQWHETLAGDSVVVGSLALSEDSVLWVGTRGQGLHRVDPDSWTVMSFHHDPSNPATIGNDRVWALLPVDDGLWVAGIEGDGQAGLSRLDISSGRFTRYYHVAADEESVGGPGGTALARTPDGSLLAGFLDGGLSVLSAGRNSVQFWRDTARQPSSRLPSVDVGAVLPVGDHTTLVGFLGDGLYRRDDRSGTVTRLPVPARYITDLASGENGTVWVGAWSGLYRLDASGSVRAVPLVADGSPTPVFSLDATDAGALWVGSREGRVFRVADGGQDVQAFRIPDQTRANRIESVAVDREGRVWTASGGRLYWMRIEDDTFAPVHLDGLTADVRFVDTDQFGLVWLGSRHDGLARLDPDSGEISWITEADGLLFNSITGLNVDAHGCIWVATDRGLHGLTPNEGVVSAYPSTARTSANKFGVHRLAVAGSSDVVYMAGLLGIVRFDVDAILPVTAPLDVLVLDVLSDDHVTAREDVRTVAFDAAARRVAIDLSVPVYTYREDVRFRYRPEGSDEWIPVGADGRIDLSAAGHGRHVMDVQATTSAVSGPVQAVTVHVAWPWWSAPWMRVLWAMLVAAALAGAAWHRVRRLSRDRERLERTVQERTATIREQADRLTALDAMKSRFFAYISHEFRTPLTLILGPVQDALEGEWGPLGDRHTADLGMMRRQGRRLLGLVNQVLDLASLDAGRLVLDRVPLDMLTLARTVVHTFSSYAEQRGVTLRFRSDDTAAVVSADAERMEQVLGNLIGNAIKFTPRDGSVMVGVAVTPDKVCISVRDTGPGIPASDQARVFDRFHQVSGHETVGQSGGIGLALVRELVMLHGGQVLLDSDPGFGATFTVLLPREHQPGVALARSSELDLDGWEETAVPPSNDHQVDQRPLVLIVEDHPDVAAYVARALSDDYRIAMASDGEEGFNRARDLRPDLVVSDVTMPVMDGFALCQAVKTDRDLALTPVILLTARADEESKMEGLGSGADDYLYKPFSARELCQRVENLIEVRRVLRRGMEAGTVSVRVSDVDLSSDDERFVERAQEAVEAQLDNSQFGAAWLADELGLSTRHLQRRLKELTGLSTNAFIRTLRLQRAHQLLDQGVGNVSEVAYAVGYSDPKYFSRIFRQAYGVPPSQVDS